MDTATFARLIEETADAEGLRLKAYRDSKGIWTIGYGTNLQELEIDRPTAYRWLVDKLQQSEREAQRFPWFAGLTDARKRAIVELIYNMGLPRVLGFVKFLTAMSQGDYVTARAEVLDSKWRVDVGDVRAKRIADAVLN